MAWKKRRIKHIDPGDWPGALPVLVIILIGAGLRLSYLGYESLWYDEAISLAIARSLELPQILANVAQSSHPPLYYLLLRFWIRAIGVNDYLVRFPSAVLSLLSIPLIYQVGRSLFDRKVGLWAALMLAVQPFQIQYAQEARMYAQLLLLTLVTLVAFTRAIRTGNLRWWSIYLVSSVLALYTHYFIGFVILSYHLFATIYRRRDTQVWIAFLVADVVAVIAFLPLTGMFVRKLNVYWLAVPSLVSLLTTPYFLVFGSYQSVIWLSYTALFGTLGSLATSVYEILRKPVRTSRQWQMLLFIGAFSPIILVFIVSQFKSFYLNRTLIICTPFLTLLLAFALRRTHAKSPLPYLVAITGVCIVIVFGSIYASPTILEGEPMREAAEFVWQNKEGDDLVIHLTQWTGLPFMAYSPPAENYLLLGNPHTLKPLDVWEIFGGRTNALESIGADRRLWVVVVPNQIGGFQQEQLRLIAATRPLLLEESIREITVHLYGEVN